MKLRHTLSIACLSALVSLFAPMGQAAAHPHNFISVRVAVLFDADGQVTALKQDWMFDELYTSYMLGGDMDKIIKSGVIPSPVQQKMTSNIESLDEYGWFMRVEQDSARLKLIGLEAFNYRMEETRLAVSFTAKLAEPVEMAGKALSYAVYDPTYYVSMTHDTQMTIPDEFTGRTEQARRKRAAGATTLDNAPKGCASRISFADPSEATILGALMLDQGESATFDLGAEFAEWVTVSCK